MGKCRVAEQAGFYGKEQALQRGCSSSGRKMSSHSYVDKDGNKHYMLEVDANSIECMSAKKPSATKENSSDASIARVELENVLGSIEENNLRDLWRCGH